MPIRGPHREPVNSTQRIVRNSPLPEKIRSRCGSHTPAPVLRTCWFATSRNAQWLSRNLNGHRKPRGGQRAFPVALSEKQGPARYMISMSVVDQTSGVSYAPLSAAITGSHAGDVIQISAGSYVENFPDITHNLTIEAVGGLANLSNPQPDP